MATGDGSKENNDGVTSYKRGNSALVSQTDKHPFTKAQQSHHTEVTTLNDRTTAATLNTPTITAVHGPDNLIKLSRICVFWARSGRVWPSHQNIFY